MWEDHDEREMRAQQAAETGITQADIIAFETCQFDTCKPCMPSDRYDKCMRVAANKCATVELDQLFEQLETMLGEIAQAEAEFRIYEQGERDPI